MRGRRRGLSGGACRRLMWTGPAKMARLIGSPSTQHDVLQDGFVWPISTQVILNYVELDKPNRLFALTGTRHRSTYPRPQERLVLPLYLPTPETRHTEGFRLIARAKRKHQGRLLRYRRASRILCSAPCSGVRFGTMCTWRNLHRRATSNWRSNRFLTRLMKPWRAFKAAESRQPFIPG